MGYHRRTLGTYLPLQPQTLRLLVRHPSCRLLLLERNGVRTRPQLLCLSSASGLPIDLDRMTRLSLLQVNRHRRHDSSQIPGHPPTVGVNHYSDAPDPKSEGTVPITPVSLRFGELATVSLYFPIHISFGHNIIYAPPFFCRRSLISKDEITAIPKPLSRSSFANLTDPVARELSRTKQSRLVDGFVPPRRAQPAVNFGLTNGYPRLDRQ